MCRSFTARKVPGPLIGRLLYSAHRAPAAGNVRSAEIIVIQDPFTIEEIKKVSPGFGGICQLLLAICTNKTSTREYEVASFDAGTIAENIALAATDLGLGVCFLKSYPDKIVEKILKIPPKKAKIEILLCVGYPRKDHVNARIQPIPIRIYEETYVNPTSPKKPLQRPPVDAWTDARNANIFKNAEGKQGSSRSSLFDVALFILTSARCTIDESNRYGPKRLMDSLIRLLNIPRTSFVEKADRGEEIFLNLIRKELEKRTDLQSSSKVYTEEFKNFLDDLIEQFVSHMKKTRRS